MTNPQEILDKEQLNEQILLGLADLEERAKKIWNARYPEGHEHHDKEFLFVHTFFICIQAEMIKKMHNEQPKI